MADAAASRCDLPAQVKLRRFLVSVQQTEDDFHSTAHTSVQNLVGTSIQNQMRMLYLLENVLLDMIW